MLSRSPSLKRIAGALAVLVLLVGMLLGAFRLAMTYVPEYRVQLQSWLSERTGLVVEFRSLHARLRLYGPELVFDDAVVRTPDRTRILATARRGSVGFDVWAAIRTGRLSAGRFRLVAPEIGLMRTHDGRIQLIGQGALESENIKPFAIEQLPTGRFQVEDAVVSFRDEITRRGPWSVSGVSFDLRRGSSEMRLTGHASLPRALGESLSFSASAIGDLEQPEQLVFNFNLEGAELDLAGLADVLPDTWPAPETGHGSLQLAGEMRGKRLVRVAAKIDLSQVAAALPSWLTPLPEALPMQQPGDVSTAGADLEAEVASSAEPGAPQLLSFDRVALELQGRVEADDTWKLSISNLDVSKRDSPWRADAIELAWLRDAERLELSGKADKVVLQNLWPFLAYAPESSALARVRALSATGVLHDASFVLARGPSRPMSYSVRARLDKIGFAPVGGVPGLRGLSGVLETDDASGRVHLDSRDLQFELPRFFRAPLDLRTFEGELAWNRQDDGWQLTSDALKLDSDDGRAQARIAVFIPKDGTSPLLELTATAQSLDARSTHKYLPAGRLGPAALAWLDRAFVAGRVSTAELIYRGRTREFPFRNDQGEFVVRGHVEGMTFDYQSGWTPATDLDGEVEFRNEGMAVRSVKARVGDLQIAGASASIGDFKRGDLAIKATASGDLQEGLRFLVASPLGPKLGEYFARLQGQGTATSTVDLRFPLKQLTRREVDVQTRVANATLSMQDVAAPVTRLNGILRVRRDFVESADLHGQWLGGPLHVLVQPVPLRDAVGSVELVATGRANAAQLATVLDLPQTVRISGATQWRASAKIAAGSASTKESASLRNVQVDADLDGFGIDLPEPLGKRPQDSLPLRLDLTFDGPQTLARAALGDVRGLFRFAQPSDSEWSFDRGTVRADAKTPSLPDQRGLRIEGDVRRFVLDDWLALQGTGAGGKKLSEVLRAASVRVEALEVFGYRWNDVRGILQATEAGWRVDVEGPDASGQLVIPEDFSGNRRLTAQFDHLVLTRLDEPRAATSKADPRRLPNARIRIDALQMQSQAIGSIDVQLSRVPQGVQMDSLTIDSPSMRGTMRGRWLETSNGQQSTLSAQVTSNDVGATLRAWNYTPFMEAKHGEISADLTWPGAPDAKFLGRSSGTLTMRVENGQLLSVQPGAGRMLGLFSVAALPRRLALDFSDLTEKGLSFDSVHGDFELRDGNAYTSNLLLRGPAAEIGVAGRTGLATRDYDQTAVVTGNLGVSLPVAGALAAGPAVGAALLLFSQVFKEPLKGIARGYYRITGPWDEPTVERVDAAQVKEAASTRSESRETG